MSLTKVTVPRLQYIPFFGFSLTRTCDNVLTPVSEIILHWYMLKSCPVYGDILITVRLSNTLIHDLQLKQGSLGMIFPLTVQKAGSVVPDEHSAVTVSPIDISATS